MPRPMRPRCEICRFWSNLVARQRPSTGMIEAMCLADEGAKAREFTVKSDTCNAFQPATHGSVDGPWARAYG